MKDTAPGSDARAKQDYFGALVLLNADGQKFDTVMAAINSSKCASCDVTLVVERQKGAPSKVEPLAAQLCPLASCAHDNHLFCFWSPARALV